MTYSGVGNVLSLDITGNVTASRLEQGVFLHAGARRGGQHTHTRGRRGGVKSEENAPVQCWHRERFRVHRRERHQCLR